MFLGFDSVLENIKTKKVKLVIVANDTSEKTKKEINFTCNKYLVPLINFGNIETNSYAIGKRNKAIIGICDSGIANRFLNLINE